MQAGLQEGWEFGRKMIKMAYDEFKYIKKDYNSLIDEFGDVDGVRELADEIKGLYDSELYERFFKTWKYTDKHHNKVKFNEEEDKKLRVAHLAYENMGRPIIYGPPFSDLITFFEVYRMYSFFLDVYQMNTGKELGYEEMEKLHLCKLDEHLIFALDKFDEVTETLEPTAEYFQKLKKVKWKNKKTKKLFEKLHILFEEIKRIKWGVNKATTVGISEKKFTLLLAGCNVINDARDKINMQDILIAYKTYFKLLKTDLPLLVDKLWEINKSKVDK
ncbi:MAG: hypothetical protein HZC47_00025 [Methanobacterium sp.]|uniref:hypothetical protein n=1 Tax=Methanobacterium sp. TaxID=2164 RepID=UPI003D66267F|nr:hypothetical protein [Methanobacterium sp.]